MIIRRTYIILLFVIQTALFSQQIYIPYNIQQAITKKTRTNIGLPGENYFQNTSNYKINATFNTHTGELSGRANITYHNYSSDTLSKIVMRLYQNIFCSEALRDEKVEEINQSNGITITDLNISGFTSIGDLKNYTRTDGTNYLVFLKEDLKPGDSCLINIAWNFTMPQSSVHRFGKYGEATYFVAMWYPQIAVYDDIDGWDEMQYNGTQEFYNDFSNFDVIISLSGNIMLWATGEWVNSEKILAPAIFERYQLAKKSDIVQHIIRQDDISKKRVLSEKKNSFHFIAQGVPDFVFAVSDHYLWDAASVTVDSANGSCVLVSSVYPKESTDFSNVASAGFEIIKRLSYESYKIAYPYRFITVFNGDGGMEYPMMVNNRSSNTRNSSVFLTAHEIAHGYFPFMTGINERKYSWMDEGLTTYLPMKTLLTMNSDYYSLSYFVAKYDAMSGTEYDIPLMIPSYQTRGYSYYFLSYYRSTMAFSMLENFMGCDTFRMAIREFIEIWQGKHPTGYDLINIFKRGSEKDIEWLVNKWFYEPGFADISIAGVSYDSANIRINIKSSGNLPVPVLLSFIYENGDTVLREKKIDIWKDRNEFEVIEPLKPGLKVIELNNLNIPDKNRKDNAYKL